MPTKEDEGKASTLPALFRPVFPAPGAPPVGSSAPGQRFPEACTFPPPGKLWGASGRAERVWPRQMHKHPCSRAAAGGKGTKEERKKEGRKGRSSWDTLHTSLPLRSENRSKGIKRGRGQTIRHLLSRPSEDDRHPPCGSGGSPEPGTPQEGQSSGAASSKGAIKALGKINAKGTDPKSASCNMPASCSHPGKLPDL